ncbi:YbaK/EbsC family protein [Vibrio hannami]|uniref:YbaK/EbsC family protein n=1 Tax=Vibrio hannami TaxID=2717094 RepID=UPI00240F741D|nr:YbaK/EbsC family protein [Vibrio hannami]MDG3087131.1 YbaK/EbsC family protein [Vibrio hannami]
MKLLEQIYQNNLTLFDQTGINYQSWSHEPILDFATDERVALELGWTGTHSKSLFLKLKSGGFALYLTEKNKRLDRKPVQSVLGKRVSICSNEEMTKAIGCVPGAVCPFGLPEEIPIVVDKELLEKEEILYTPGLPEVTFGFSGKDLKPLLEHNPNTIHYI